MTLERPNAPVWIIFLGDLFICFISICAAYFLRFNFRIPSEEIVTLPLVFLAVLLIRAFSFSIFQTHRGIIRFTNTKDVERIFLSIAAGSTFFLVINPILLLFKQA